MNNAKSVQQLIKEAHDYALAGRVEAALDSYNEALAILISLETILAGQGEGTQSVVMTANPELQASAHSEKLTQARTLVAHEAVSLCITTGQAESAFQYLSILKGRRLMMRLARSQSEDKFPKSDFRVGGHLRRRSNLQIQAQLLGSGLRYCATSVLQGWASGADLSL
jgi:hypothetical protein